MNEKNLISHFLLSFLTNDAECSRFNDVAAYTVAQEEHIVVRLGGGCSRSVSVINDMSDSRDGRVVHESCSCWRSTVVIDVGSQDGRIVRQFQFVSLR